MTTTPSRKRKALAAILVGEREARGMSRSEVAERAGVGPAWYEWVEEGRHIGLSATALGWVSDAIGIRGPMRDRIFALADVRAEGEVVGSAEPVSSLVTQLLDAMAPNPAYVIGRRGHVLAWNPPTEAVYRCHLVPPLCRNVYMFLFAQPDVRKLIVNWEEQAHRLVNDFKKARSADPRDAVLVDLRRRLSVLNPDFRRIYRSRPRPDQRQTIFSHPRVGAMTFDLQDLDVDRHPGQKIRVYAPRDAATRARLSHLMQLHRRDDGNEAHRTMLAKIRRAKDHLDQCYSRAVPLDELTGLLRMDKFGLIRAFAKEVGYPPYAYQLMVRIFHARRYLAGGYVAAEVAAMVGFADQSHLIRHFRRIEGVTPAAFVAASRRTGRQ